MFKIIDKEFKSDLYNIPEDLKNWPMLYLLENGKKIYVGQSNRIPSRMEEHKNNQEKKLFKMIHMIHSKKFNLSATLDYESKLIQLIAADEQYIITNKNDGIANRDYYNKEYYEQRFHELWEQLRNHKLVKHTINELLDSDLFKYSPFKELTREQKIISHEIINLIEMKPEGTIIVEGMPGSGKTILCTYMFKLLRQNEAYQKYTIGLVVPQTSLRSTLKKVFKQIGGLKSCDIISASDVLKKKYDILMVDEAHRLKKRKSITNYASHDKNNEILGLAKDADEMDWIMKASTYQIFFYDPLQVVAPSGVEQDLFNRKLIDRMKYYYKLYSQMRVKGGKPYIEYITKLLNQSIKKKAQVHNYEFKLVHKFKDFNDLLYEKEERNSLCRMIAGFAWPWASKKDKSGQVYDICIEGMDKRWNNSTENWVNSENAINEVGCIHSIQGYDLNYAFVIIGNDMQYKDNKIIVDKKNYFDVKGKNSTTYEELLTYIRNIYYVLMTRGIKGTYLYICNDELRAYFEQFVDTWVEKGH